MSADLIIAAVVALFAVLTGLIKIISVIVGITTKISNLDHKVNVMWDFLMRRAEADIVLKNLGTFNSPLVISDEMRSWFGPMKHDLRKFYQERGTKLKEADLLITLEHAFGDRLTREICIPHEINSGACLLAASVIAKEVD